MNSGFKVIEVHAAHGYLLHQFVSPLSNLRQDGYGGDPERRWRLVVEIVAKLKAMLPPDGALLVRVSGEDGADGGNGLPDTVAFARALGAAGADAIDCSSGGIAGRASANRLARGLGFQVPFAAAIRRESGIPTVAVGLILDGPQAEAILQAGDADLGRDRSRGARRSELGAARPTGVAGVGVRSLAAAVRLVVAAPRRDALGHRCGVIVRAVR